MNTIKIRVLKGLGKYKIGTTVTVNCDKAGSPMAKFWRKRLKDAKTDSCCEVYVTPKPENKPLSKRAIKPLSKTKKLTKKSEVTK